MLIGLFQTKHCWLRVSFLINHLTPSPSSPPSPSSTPPSFLRQDGKDTLFGWQTPFTSFGTHRDILERVLVLLWCRLTRSCIICRWRFWKRRIELFRDASFVWCGIPGIPFPPKTATWISWRLAICLLSFCILCDSKRWRYPSSRKAGKVSQFKRSGLHDFHSPFYQVSFGTIKVTVLKPHHEMPEFSLPELAILTKVFKTSRPDHTTHGRSLPDRHTLTVGIVSSTKEIW